MVTLPCVSLCWMDDDFLIGPCAYKLRAPNCQCKSWQGEFSCPFAAAATVAGLDPCNSSKIWEVTVSFFPRCYCRLTFLLNVFAPHHQIGLSQFIVCLSSPISSSSSSSCCLAKEEASERLIIWPVVVVLLAPTKYPEMPRWMVGLGSQTHGKDDDPRNWKSSPKSCVVDVFFSNRSSTARRLSWWTVHPSTRAGQR